MVLLDDNLPANRSIELLNLIKKTNDAIPVIILANGIDNFTKLKYKALGADQFFDKYHEFELIPGVVNSLSYRTLTIQNYEQE
ncbi:MAG: response regulator [Ferruginibacter sp.]